MALGICRWKTTHLNIRLLSHGSTCFSHSLPVTRYDESKAIEKVNVMDEATKSESVDHMENLWKSFFATPYEWLDYRMIKKNPKAPDFKHSETGEVLWVGSCKTPNWVESKLRSLKREEFAASQSLEQLWKLFFADPSKWFDHRKTKKSVRHPDFLHKYTREALWIKDIQAPTWVTPMFKGLSSESFESSPAIGNLWKSLFSNPSKWIDNRKIKKSKNFPDFEHKENGAALWIDGKRTPAWALPKLNDLKVEAFVSPSSLEDLWIYLFLNQSKWIDYREIKTTTNLPDFVHKDTTEALWIKGIGTPTWVTPMLSNLQSEAFAPFPIKEDGWITLFSNPSKWHDYRKNKKTKKFPDFKHKENGKGLWIHNKKTPTWVLQKLIDLPSKAFASTVSGEDLWISFFDDTSKWFDYSNTKKSDKHPDFVHKDTTKALWINVAETPVWVTLMLKKLQPESFAPSPPVEDLWKLLFSDPSKWFDNRSTKKSSRYPDFKHINNQEALWLDNAMTPVWVLPQLKYLQHEAFACPDKIGVSYEDK